MPLHRQLTPYRKRYASKRSRVPGTSLTGPRNYKISRQGKTWPNQTPRTYQIAWDPFPSLQKAVLRYSEVVTISTTTGLAAAYLFRCNSIFDPNYTGIGHQPYGHDIYKLIYNKYRVTGSRITATPTSTFDGIYGIAITDDPTINVDYNTVRETKGNTSVVGQISTPSQQITNYWSEKYLPLQPTHITANMGTNPNAMNYYHLYLEGSTILGPEFTRSFMVNITYDVEFSELKDLGQS